MKKLALLVLLLFVFVIIVGDWNVKQNIYPEIRKEFEVQGLTWRTISYYYHPGVYKEIYNQRSNIRLIRKAKNVGANYLLVRAFYNGTPDGNLIGNDIAAEKYLKKAISTAHNSGIKILLTPYVESRDYWVTKKWSLSEDVWTGTVLKWARFAEENGVEMFAPGVEMNLIMNENRSGEWLKAILPQIREVYNGKIITAEQYDIDRWKLLDGRDAFAGYDCIGLTVFPRKEYNGVSDIRSFEDYKDYVEGEAKVIDLLSKKYNITCKLAVPIGLDYWRGTEAPVPSADVVATATGLSLDILKKHNFTGVFISHWASEPDHFGNNKEVEQMLAKRWTTRE